MRLTLTTILGAGLAILAGGLHAQPAGDAVRGEAAYEKCAACHALDEGGESDLGPILAGMFGRKAGSREDYRYSAAMRRSTVVWDASTLDAFLADPQGTVRNNRMPFEGMPDAQERADLIAYLEQATRTRN